MLPKWLFEKIFGPIVHELLLRDTHRDKTNRTKFIFWGEKLQMKSRQVISCHPRIQREANVHRMLIKSKSNGKD